MKEKAENSIKKINPLKGLNGAWIVKNTAFFLFLAALTVAYIANGHFGDKTLRDIDKTEAAIEQLQYEYKTVKSELMMKTEESELLKNVQSLGLQISKEVPQRIVTKQ